MKRATAYKKPDIKKRHSSNWRLLGLAGIIGPAIFLSIMFSLDVIQWENNHVLETISDLVHGSFGWLQTMAFILIGVLLIAFVIRLYSITRKKISSLTGSSLFSITGIGFFLIAAFPSQIGGIGQTIEGLIHNSIAGLISGSFIFGCIAFAVHFRKDPHWKPYWIYTVITVICCMVFAFLWGIMPDESALKAMSERLVLLSGFMWMVVLSFKLIRSHHRPQEIPVPVEIEDKYTGNEFKK